MMILIVLYVCIIMVPVIVLQLNQDIIIAHLVYGWTARAYGITAGKWAQLPAHPGPVMGVSTSKVLCAFAKHLHGTCKSTRST